MPACAKYGLVISRMLAMQPVCCGGAYNTGSGRPEGMFSALILSPQP